MWDKLEEVFKALGLPYSRQGSYAKDEKLPKSFFTFWNYDTPEGGFYDNRSHNCIWVWYVYFYTSDPSLIYTKMDSFCKIASSKGFILNGKPNDIPSDEPDYYGRFVQIAYIENYDDITEVSK